MAEIKTMAVLRRINHFIDDNSYILKKEVNKMIELYLETIIELHSVATQFVERMHEMKAINLTMNRIVN